MEHRTALRLCILLCSLSANLVISAELLPTEDYPPTSPGFIVSWFNDTHVFKAGDISTIRIELMGDLENNMSSPLGRYLDRFTIAIRGRKGNSSFISGVFTSPETDYTHWNMTFIPILVGKFQVAVEDDLTRISDQSLDFSVTPGDMYPAVCVASWVNLVNEFVAGTKARVLILPKDAFGNNISSTTSGASSKFIVSAFYENGSMDSSLSVTYMDWNQFGYIGIEFVPITAGKFFLHLEGENQTLNGSPLTFKVNPGPLDITKCTAKWNYETNTLQIFSNLEIFVYQKDQFGNLVTGLYNFDARVVEKATNLSVPVADLQFEEVKPGIQLLSFSLSEPGEFVLIIIDANQNRVISSMRYDYTVFVGYCHGLNSVVNGSGLAGAVAGQTSSFSVYLQDIYHNPTPIEIEWLRVQIIRKTDSFKVEANVAPVLPVDGPGPVVEHGNPRGDAGGSPELSGKNVTSSFIVFYVPEKFGSYEVWVFCGNIPLNGGRPYTPEVSPGIVNTSLSSVVTFSQKVMGLIRNEVVVQLVDKFLNPVTSQQIKLGFDFGPFNNSGFLGWAFVDKKDGTYVGQYLAMDTGTYEICVLFGGQKLAPCPLKLDVYKRDYFPEVFNDTISVWENESVAFNVLQNDYFPDGGVSIIELSMPSHGSLLPYGPVFRYTPYKGFFGNDSFSYTISDINKNIATGTAIISVFSSPPQFVSLPPLLQAMEDIISPKFSGFTGFEIKYSDRRENISVSLSAKSGTVFLAPMPMQFWKPLESEFSVNRGGKAGRDLIIVGRVEVINSALQLLQYLGNENFYGNDVIILSAMNKYGTEVAHVPISVEPMNDPPLIHVPKYISLEMKEAKESLQIFDKQRHAFEFSIEDPDLLDFPGSKSQFIVTLSVEVSAGIIITTLPVDLVNKTELMLENSYQWQPLMAFVTISSHFLVKGKGFRIRGSIEDCNNAMEQLLYQGTEHGAVLSIGVNDMGSYGCYPDCTEMMSLPLHTEATINLIKRRPMSSLVAHLLGSVIIIEFIAMLSLGLVLLLFICKCATALGYERKRSSSSSNEIELSEVEDVNKSTLSATFSEDVAYFTDCSTPFMLRSHKFDFCQRSRRRYKSQESMSDEFQSLQNVPQGSPRTSVDPHSI